MNAFVRIVLIVGVFGGGMGVFQADGYAQSRGASAPEFNSDRQLPTERESRVGRVPDWARTSEGQRRSSGTQPSFRNGISTKGHNGGSGGGAGPGSTVPVDGGLLWLVLAGGGYAGWKLGLGRKGREE